MTRRADPLRKSKVRTCGTLIMSSALTNIHKLRAIKRRGIGLTVQFALLMMLTRTTGNVTQTKGHGVTMSWVVSVQGNGGVYTISAMTPQWMGCGSDM